MVVFKNRKLIICSTILVVILATGLLIYNNYFSKQDKLIMIHNTLYKSTDKTGPMGDSGCVEGHIKSSVSKNKIPTANEQSNFGAVGNPYTYDDGDGWIMVLVHNEYYIFDKLY